LQSASTQTSNRALTIGNATYSEVIVPSGNVGIGTTSPAHKLDVNSGSIFLDSDWPVYFGSTSALIEGNSSGTILRSNASAGFKWTDGGNTHMTLDTNGNLGIGTTSPQQPLDVNTNSTGLNVDNTAAIFGNDVGTTQSRDTWIKMKASSQTDDRSWAFGTQQLGDFRFNYLGDRTITPTNAAASTLLTIKNSGNIGIGTTSPSENLTVGDGTDHSTINIDKGASSNGTLLFNKGGASSAYIKHGIYEDLDIASGAGTLQFLTGTSNLTRMVIQADGDVGIGTTSPSAKLHVAGTSFFFDQAIFDDKVGIGESNPASKLEITGGNIQLTDGWGLRWDDAANTQLLASASDGFKFSTGGSERARIDSDGSTILQDGVTYTTNAPTHRGVLILSGASAPTNFGGIEFHTNSGGGFGYGTKIYSSDATWGVATRNNSATFSTSFEINGSTGNSYFTGNVGIGRD